MDQASSDKAFAAKPLSTIGLPATAVNPPSLIAVILYRVAAGPLESLLRLMPRASSLQAVAVWLATTGSG